MKKLLLLFLVCISVKAILAQGKQAPVRIITDEFCTKQDLSPLLATWEETGTTGVFGENYARIQIHFEAITKDAVNPKIYHITGASRHMKNVTPFEGEIVIDNVIQFDRQYYWASDTLFGTHPEQVPSEPEYDETTEKYTEVSATYVLREDSASKYSGIFSGELSFALHETIDNSLLNDLIDYQGDGYTNFTYDGIWANYKSGKSVRCSWGDGRLPVPMGVDIGAGEFSIHEKYEKHGWQRDENFELIDNPKFWWK